MSTHDPTTRLLGRLLGEIYRIQNATKGMVPPAAPGQIYGLLNGIDEAIDLELENTKGISNDKLEAAADVVEPIFHDPDQLEKFTGFYDIEDELTARGITRPEAMQIFTYWKANAKFTPLIEKMNSGNSPIECKTFELNEFEK